MFRAFVAAFLVSLGLSELQKNELSYFADSASYSLYLKNNQTETWPEFHLNQTKTQRSDSLNQLKNLTKDLEESLGKLQSSFEESEQDHQTQLQTLSKNISDIKASFTTTQNFTSEIQKLNKKILEESLTHKQELTDLTEKLQKVNETYVPLDLFNLSNEHFKVKTAKNYQNTQKNSESIEELSLQLKELNSIVRKQSELVDKLINKAKLLEVRRQEDHSQLEKSIEDLTQKNQKLEDNQRLSFWLVIAALIVGGVALILSIILVSVFSFKQSRTHSSGQALLHDY